jgi:CYTH domain-containing protein
VAAGREIERKFLVSAIPDNRGLGTRILQGYLPLASEDTEVRVRRKGAETVLPVKQAATWTEVSGRSRSALRCSRRSGR